MIKAIVETVEQALTITGAFNSDTEVKVTNIEHVKGTLVIKSKYGRVVGIEAKENTATENSDVGVIE